MKFIKTITEFLAEDLRIISETPKYFYLVLRSETALESLSNLRFDNLVGISDNPKIITSWLDVRDTLLVMDGKEVLKNNSLFKIDYSNVDKLVSKNFEILNRLLANKKLYIYDCIQKIFSSTQRIKLENDKVYKTINLLNDILYKVTNLFETEIKNGTVINNFWQFINIIWDNLPDMITKHNKDYSYKLPYEITYFDKNILYYTLQEGLILLCKSFEKEGEWVIKTNKLSNKKEFNIPINSKLYFKTVVKNEDELRFYIENDYRQHSNGLKDKKLDEILEFIDVYNLNNLYDIKFVEGYVRLFNEYSVEPIPNTISYSRIMNNKFKFNKKKKS